MKNLLTTLTLLTVCLVTLFGAAPASAEQDATVQGKPIAHAGKLQHLGAERFDSRVGKAYTLNLTYTQDYRHAGLVLSGPGSPVLQPTRRRKRPLW